ncbi:MAG TPA: hypothetical protein VM820_20590 [Vicinamibacterales bacterium]|nr:hypothetical protein [Vicinamibacterales bacterium]
MQHPKALLVSSVLAVACASLVATVSRGPATFVKMEKFNADPDATYEKDRDSRVAAVGANEGGPLAAEEEKYANRAFPGTDVPFAATIAARAAFDAAAARGVGNAAGAWSLYGPSTSTMPGTLSFYGGGPSATYVTSGRITALAIAPTCTASNCRVWVGAAGGGIWITDKALAGAQNWRFVSEELGTNAIGSLLLDPTDRTGNTLYAGTGEANASGDSESGVGLYKSTDGGESWNLVPATASFANARAIGSIAIDPTDGNNIYVATARAVRGVSSVTGGAVSQPVFGLYESTDGGATWVAIWDGNASLRGVRRIKLDPLNPNTIYASAYQQGLWRSTNGGAFERIFYPTAPGLNTSRTEFDVTIKDNATRIYIGDGAQGTPPSAVFRADNVNNTPASTLTSGTTNPGWTSLTSSDPTDPRYGSYNFCTGQCWYDSYIVTPAGFPDIVYLGGSHQYGETYGRSNGRGVVMSTDGGNTFTDMTVEGATPSSAINLHPDHHALVTHPGDPFTFFSGSDGGIVRSNGRFRDVSAQCDARGLSAPSLVACKRLLSRVPERLYSLNRGLSTLQFQSVRVDPGDPKNLIGGTQDNGTWINNGSSENWDETIYGDGGQSGFSSDGTGRRLFNTFTGQANDANFRRGDPRAWVVIGGPILSSPEGAAFYPPVTADPNPQRPGSIFQGSFSVWRTQNWGGDQADLEARCPEFTTSAAEPTCGDFVRIGPAGNTDLGGTGYGTTRAGGVVAAIERSAGDTGSLWAATSVGRVFISSNADAAAASVVFTRLDSLAANAPGRFVSSIYVDPDDGNHAWISYSGYNATTPAQPGHVFEVRYNPTAGTATWTNLDGGTGPLGDLPVTDLVRDDVTGDLYAATDFGVLVQAAGTTAWLRAGAGLPMVEVAGLTIVPSERLIYAATHGRSAWRMSLP